MTYYDGGVGAGIARDNKTDSERREWDGYDLPLYWRFRTSIGPDSRFWFRTPEARIAFAAIVEQSGGTIRSF